MCCIITYVRYENEHFKIAGMLYKSLTLYRSCITKIEMWPWWVFAHYNPEYTLKVRVLYRMIVSQSCLRTDVYMFDKSSSLCILCDLACEETAHHMLFECPKFHVKRTEIWHNALQKLPQAFAAEINNMNCKKKTEFICRAFNSRYIPEWNMIYKFLLDFIYFMYSKRKNIV